MAKIIFYSNDCPRCKVLKAKLDEKGIEYEENNNIQDMINKNIVLTPCLEVDNELMEYVEAINWVKEER